MDQSVTRRGQPCYYRVEGVNLIAINDAFLRGGVQGEPSDLDDPDDDARAERIRTGEEQVAPPSFGLVLTILLLPLVLIAFNTVIGTLRQAGAAPEDDVVLDGLAFIGQTPVALLITLLVATYLLGTRAGSPATVESILNDALGPICSIILITGAGGMFGGVLRYSGIGSALSDSLADLGLPLIVSAFVISTLLRVAQGSATVALTTAAGLIAPAVLAGDYNAVQLAAVVVTVAAGSVVLSHVNDSGFWLVGRFLEMDVRTTFKTWTVLETIIGVVGFALAAVVFGVAGVA